MEKDVRGMRCLARVVVVAAAALLPAAATAQVSPHGPVPEDGDRFCAGVYVQTRSGLADPERTDFVHAPEVADDPSAAFTPDFEGAVRADRVAFWWTVPPDSVAAYMIGSEDTVWLLRLGRGGPHGASALEGTLRQALPEGSPHVAGVLVVTLPCRER